MRTDQVTDTAPAVAVADPPARHPVRRLLPWLAIPLYLAGVAAYVVLERRLGNPGLGVVDGLGLAIGFGMFACMGALLIAQRPRNARRLDPGRYRSARRASPRRGTPTPPGS